jgi:cation diffusion facilitator family transporter
LTQLLIRCFLRKKGEPNNPEVRTAYGNLAGIVGIVCNVLLFAGKFLAGTLFGSIAITADAINNLSDASSNVVSLIGFRLGAKKPDAKHPYGHARYEYLAGLAVSVMILAIGLSLLQESVAKTISPQAVKFSFLSVGVLAASILVKLWMSVFNKKIGETIHSETLIATAADSRNDVISTAAVLAATILVKLTGVARIDGLMGLGVALFILWSGLSLVRDTISPLLGESPDPALVKHIEEKVMAYPGVLGMHDLMVHDYGPGQQFASLHIEFPAEADVLETHDRIDNIEKDFLANDHILVTIHYDPIVTKDAAVSETRTYLKEQLAQIDPALSIHDLRLVPGPTHTNVLFDLVLPAGYKGECAAVVEQLKAAMRQKNETYFCVIKIEQDYTAQR